MHVVRSCSLVLVGFSLCATLATAQAQVNCRTIRFERGASSAKVQGMAPAKGVDCLRFGAGAGQDVEISITSPSKDLGFTVEGVADNRDHLKFKSKKKTYDVLVAHTFRAVEPAKYELTLSIR